MSTFGTRTQRFVAVVLAVLAALAVWVIAELIVGTDLRAPAQGGSEETGDVTAAVVAVTSLVASLAGWALLAALERVTARARKAWTWIASIVLVISFGGPLAAAGISGANKAWLAAMHVAVGAVLIPLLFRSARARTSERAPDLADQAA